MNNTKFIYFINTAILIIEKNVRANSHHHHAIQITIRVKPESHIFFNAKRVEENTIIFNADKIHSLDSNLNWVIILLINPESELGNHIRSKYLMKNDDCIRNIRYSSHLLNHFYEIITTPKSKSEVLHIYDEIINSVCGSPSESFRLDDRIRRVFNEIKKLEEKTIPARDLASLVYLSESRFMHLFKEEVKIPVRQYLSWLRLLDALRMIINGESFTKAALYSGFTDLPHLHKTFTHYFGARITDYFKNSRFIQVFDFSGE